MKLKYIAKQANLKLMGSWVKVTQKFSTGNMVTFDDIYQIVSLSSGGSVKLKDKKGNLLKIDGSDIENNIFVLQDIDTKKILKTSQFKMIESDNFEVGNIIRIDLKGEVVIGEVVKKSLTRLTTRFFEVHILNNNLKEFVSYVKEKFYLKYLRENKARIWVLK